MVREVLPTSGCWPLSPLHGAVIASIAATSNGGSGELFGTCKLMEPVIGEEFPCTAGRQTVCRMVFLHNAENVMPRLVFGHLHRTLECQ